VSDPPPPQPAAPAAETPAMSFACCGVYDPAIAALVEGLGWRAVRPPPVTAETIRLGVRYASEMICFPYKVTLGSVIQLAQSGVEHVLTYNTQGDCRYSHFGTLYRDVLKKLDLPCQVHTVDTKHLLRSFRACAHGRLRYLRLARGLLEARRRMLAGEGEQEARYTSPPVKVLIAGEAFSSLIPEVNCDLRSHLLKLGLGSIVPAAFSYYFKHRYYLRRSRLPEDRRAHALLSAPIGGCAYESLRNTLAVRRLGCHGVIHLYPLTCMPETTIAQLLDTVAEEQGVPLLHLEIDENVSRLNVHNRVEAFAEIVALKARHG
jgi:predicted nucleotide-binding protein (sugar kinase/HSP70/actin superfamily)